RGKVGHPGRAFLRPGDLQPVTPARCSRASREIPYGRAREPALGVASGRPAKASVLRSKCRTRVSPPPPHSLASPFFDIPPAPSPLDRIAWGLRLPSPD